jgi:hypothetical protein
MLRVCLEALSALRVDSESLGDFVRELPEREPARSSLRAPSSVSRPYPERAPNRLLRLRGGRSCSSSGCSGSSSAKRETKPTKETAKIEMRTVPKPWQVPSSQQIAPISVNRHKDWRAGSVLPRTEFTLKHIG